MEKKGKKLLALPPSDGEPPVIRGKFSVYCRKIEQAGTSYEELKLRRSNKGRKRKVKKKKFEENKEETKEEYYSY